MKTIYTRFGHANNSSSSHSIVFLDREVADGNVEDYRYHWDFFTLGSRIEKERYLFSQLYVNAERMVSDTHSASKLMDYKESQKAQEIILKNWFMNRKHEISAVFAHADTFYKDIFEQEDYEDDWRSTPSVDHQSVMHIPTNAETKRLDLGFFLEFCQEVLKPGYAILGGNDNSDYNHDLESENVGVALIVKKAGW